MDLNILQEEHAVWLAANFPQQKSHQPLLGLTEEVGELAHAHLKAEQGIRNYVDHREAVADAIGDIVIFLASYCNTNGYDLGTCVDDAWDEVKQREWNRFRQNGVDA